MLKKSLKKFTGIFATTMIMANTIGSSVPVMAANTSDTIYRINVESSTGSYKRVQERDKQNNTKVYVNITASPTQYEKFVWAWNTGDFKNRKKIILVGIKMYMDNNKYFIVFWNLVYDGYCIWQSSRNGYFFKL